MNRTPNTPRRRRERGSTFVEVILATLVVGTTLVATTSSMAGSAEVYSFFADGPHEALMLAQEIHEAATLLPWESEVGDPPAYGDDVVDFWDLDGKSYHPPRSATYDQVVSHLKWTQEVAITFVDLEHPTVQVDPDTFEGEMLVQLEVTVYRLDELMDTFKWWMTEPAAD